MAVPVQFSGPEPPEGAALGWCVTCAGGYKGDGLDLLNDRVKAVQRGKAPPGTVLDLAEAGIERVLRPAIAWGMTVMPVPPTIGQGAIPVLAPQCWSHLMGLNLTSSSLQAAVPGQLLGGPGPGLDGRPGQG